MVRKFTQSSSVCFCDKNTRVVKKKETLSLSVHFDILFGHVVGCRIKCAKRNVNEIGNGGKEEDQLLSSRLITGFVSFRILYL